MIIGISFAVLIAILLIAVGFLPFAFAFVSYIKKSHEDITHSTTISCKTQVFVDNSRNSVAIIHHDSSDIDFDKDNSKNSHAIRV